MSDERFQVTHNILTGNIIIFDFEVFRYDVLFGALIINNDGIHCYQTWNKSDIKELYLENLNSVWFGHNNKCYDNLILQAIVYDDDPYKTSKLLIETEDRCPIRLNMHLNNLDLMRMAGKDYYSLKMTEGACGKDICESEVDFNLDRPLASDERLLTEKYNRSDLSQTYDNFIALKDQWTIRFKLCKEFGLDLSHLNDTEAMLGANVLGCHRVKGIEEMYVAPSWYDDLRLDDISIRQYKCEKITKSTAFFESDLKSFYLNEEFRKGSHFLLDICGSTITGGSGGMHSAIAKYHCEHALYLDVSGFYNLIMILKNLLPRGLNEEGKERYIYCYHEQLRLKKINPVMRQVYKTVLLTIFGGMNNDKTEFYDPYNFSLVMIVGQLYIVDLLQKLQGKIILVQTNTDGIIVEPLEWDKRDEIIKIVEEWEDRTGFTIKKVPIHNIWQRDVNNYIFVSDDGTIETKGDYGIYGSWENIFERKSWKLNEPPIIATAIVDFLIKGILPEDTIKENRHNLRMFQYLCKKGSYRSMEYVVKDECENVMRKDTLQNVNRCFAYNSLTEFGMIYKINPNKKSKYPYLPDNVFVFNEDINNEENANKILDMIDWNYYVMRSYKKLAEIVQI